MCCLKTHAAPEVAAVHRFILKKNGRGKLKRVVKIVRLGSIVMVKMYNNIFIKLLKMY
jgi:hypothetical protein